MELLEELIDEENCTFAFIDGNTMYRFYRLGIHPWMYYNQNPWELMERLQNIMEQMQW